MREIALGAQYTGINQATTDAGATPVFMAASDGHVDVVKLLLDHNFDPNQARAHPGATLVYKAAAKGHVKCLKLLREHNGDQNQAESDDGQDNPYSMQLRWMGSTAFSGLRTAQTVLQPTSLVLPPLPLRNTVLPSSPCRAADCRHHLGIIWGGCCIVHAHLHYGSAAARTARPG